MLTKSCRHKDPDLTAPIEGDPAQGVCAYCCKWIWSSLFITRTDYLEAADEADCVRGAIRYEEDRERREAKKRKGSDTAACQKRSE
jgi:hypothetical protein